MMKIHYESINSISCVVTHIGTDGFLDKYAMSIHENTLMHTHVINK